MTHKIEIAKKENSTDIKNIYSHYILNTTFSFEYVVPTRLEFEKRITNTLNFFPYLVYKIDGQIVGYAYAGKHAERAAYGYNATISVYVDKSFTGKKIGVRLYNSVLEILALQNIINVYAIISGGNNHSIAMHEKIGFENVATFKNTGYKNGQWIDLVWLQKTLNTYSTPPKEVVNFNNINKALISQILEKYI